MRANGGAGPEVVRQGDCPVSLHRASLAQLQKTCDLSPTVVMLLPTVSCTALLISGLLLLSIPLFRRQRSLFVLVPASDARASRPLR